MILLANLGARAVSVELAELGIERSEIAVVHQPLLPVSEAADPLGADGVEVPGLGIVVLELR